MFLEATELEKLGKVFEAMYLYRQATHIVPDIEFKMYEASKAASADNGNGNFDWKYTAIIGSLKIFIFDSSTIACRAASRS